MSALQGTRLVETLARLEVSAPGFPRPNPARRLAAMIDFGESMQIASMLAEVERVDCTAAKEDDSDLKTKVLHTRIGLVKAVTASFVPGSGSRTRLPTLGATTSLEMLATFEPYHRFYATHQREFESQLQALEFSIRDAIRGRSPQLTKLAALDEGLRETLTGHTRRQLAIIPRLLAQRFASLRQSCDEVADEQRPEAEILRDWIAPGAWLAVFFQDMQALLLAELDLRLLPALGLIEATEEYLSNRI